jgi:hypothetical protein
MSMKFDGILRPTWLVYPRLATVIVFVLALLPSRGRAAEGEHDVRVASSLSVAARTNDGLAWDTRIILTTDESFAFRGGHVRLAVPLPEGETLEPAVGIEAERDAHGRIAGFVVRPEALDDRTLHMTLVQHVPARGSFTLGAPVAAGGAVQIVDGGSLAIAPGSVMEPHVGFVTARAIGHEARAEARRLTGYETRVSGHPIYVRGNDVREVGGLTASIAEPRSKRGSLAIFAVFGVIVGALVLAAKRLRHAASVERADALLASEIEKSAS